MMEPEDKSNNNRDDANAGDEPLGFTSSHVTDDLFKEILKGINPEARLVHWRPSTLNTENSILAHLNSEDEEVKSFVGHICYKIQYQLPGDPEGVYHAKKVVLKSKPQADGTKNTLVNIAKTIGGEYGDAWEKFIDQLGFSNTNHKEIQALRLTNPGVVSVRPSIYHTWVDTEQSIFVFVMENFIAEGYTHMDTVDDISVWTTDDIDDALRGIAAFHAAYYGRISDIPSEFSKWMDPPQSKATLMRRLPMWRVALDHNAKHYPDVWPADAVKLMNTALGNLESVCDILETSPLALVHNDFNVRNVCLRPQPTKDQSRLCVYDWELVAFAPPQHDVAEFLSFVLPPDTNRSTWQSYIEKYRSFLEEELEKKAFNDSKYVKEALEMEKFQQVFDMSVAELLINRFSLYGVAHYVNPYPFLTRVIGSAINYLSNVRDDYTFLKN